MHSDHRPAIATIGERLAAAHLAKLGYKIVERNFRTREGEIDIVALGRGALVFCEVKTLIARRLYERGPASPLEAIGPAKRTQIRRLARIWLATHANARGCFRELRFDAIGVVLTSDGRPLRVQHLERAF